MDGEHPPEDDRPEEPVGSVTEEAGRLFAALGDWARDQGPDLGAGAPVAEAAGTAAEAIRRAGQHAAGGGEHQAGEGTCTWCPLCRGVHAVRSASPEVRTQLGVAATALLQAGTAFLAGLGAEQARAGNGSADRETPVERIELDEDLPGGDDRPGNDDGWEA